LDRAEENKSCSISRLAHKPNAAAKTLQAKVLLPKPEAIGVSIFESASPLTPFLQWEYNHAVMDSLPSLDPDHSTTLNPSQLETLRQP
jgi:hypothetical protein